MVGENQEEHGRRKVVGGTWSEEGGWRKTMRNMVGGRWLEEHGRRKVVGGKPGGTWSEENQEEYGYDGQRKTKRNMIAMDGRYSRGTWRRRTEEKYEKNWPRFEPGISVLE
jgi:hypothetical protein